MTLDRRERAVEALVKLGGRDGYTKREKGVVCSWVHSPARPKGVFDDHASVQVYASGFYKDHGGYEAEWARFGLKPIGTLEALERAIGKTENYEDIWKHVFPPKGASLAYIQERLLNAELVGGNDEHVYFPLKNLEYELVGMQTRTIVGKSYRVLEGSEKNASFHPEGLAYDTIYLTEGATDTFSLLSFVPNVVGLLSCSWLEPLKSLPMNKTYISLFDNDEAGYAANMKLKEILPTVQFIDFSEHKDVNEWLTKDATTFINRLNNAPHTNMPADTIIAEERKRVAAKAKVERITLTDAASLTGPLQAYRISPVTLPLPGEATICNQTNELCSGTPILIRDISLFEAEWMAYTYKTCVYLLMDNRE